MGFLGRFSKVKFDILALLITLLLFSKAFWKVCPYGANFRCPEVQLRNWFQRRAGSAPRWGTGELGHPSRRHGGAAAKRRRWFPVCCFPGHCTGGVGKFYPSAISHVRRKCRNSPLEMLTHYFYQGRKKKRLKPLWMPPPRQKEQIKTGRLFS